MEIHHVGYLVKNIEKAKESLVGMGYNISKKICYDTLRDIDLCFMENGGYLIELVQPKSEKSVVWNLLKKYGNAPYHICYVVENMEDSMEMLKKRKFIVTSEPQEAIGLNGCRVSFLMGREIGLIELLEL